MTIFAFAVNVDQDQAAKNVHLIFDLHCLFCYNVVDKNNHDIAIIRVRILH